MPTRRRTSKDTPAKLAKRMSRRWRVSVAMDKCLADSNKPRTRAKP